ncbi:MAG: hypothetical protein ACPGUV_08320 [Polyangiales bacterium]
MTTAPPAMVNSRRFEDFTQQTMDALSTLSRNQVALGAKLDQVGSAVMPAPFAKEVDRATDIDGDVVVLAAMLGGVPAAELAFAQCAREWSGHPNLKWRVFHHDGLGTGLAAARDALGIQHGATVVAVRCNGVTTTHPLPAAVTPTSLRHLVEAMLSSIHWAQPPR